ncbi:MAG: hypothetical protein H0X02_12390, partial [Nitrosomonas sp.]|nr:hypothetical protein [Nitrosomonas sp.]
MTDAKDTIPESASKVGNEVKKPLPGGKHFPDTKASTGERIKANWLWILAHSLNFAYVLNCFFQGDGLRIFSVVIFMCIIFVQLYTDHIKPLPLEGTDPDEKNKIEENRSQQRNKWMIFAYSFMLLSLWLTFYPFLDSFFTPNESKPNKEPYLETLHERPIAVFVGCSLDPEAKTLRCPKTKSEPVKDDGIKKDDGKAEEDAKFGSAWVINIGGYVKECTNDKDESRRSVICEVKDGLLVPLYFIIMALMGGSIS